MPTGKLSPETAKHRSCVARRHQSYAPRSPQSHRGNTALLVNGVSPPGGQRVLVVPNGFRPACVLELFQLMANRVCLQQTNSLPE